MLKRGTLLALAMVATTFSAAQAGGHTITEQIDQRNTAFEAAFAAGDGAAIGAMYTDDGTILPPGGAAITGPEAIGKFWQGVIDSGVARVELMTDEVEKAGDLAIEVSNFEMYAADGSVAASGKYVVVWKRDGNAWKLHRDIWNAGN